VGRLAPQESTVNSFDPVVIDLVNYCRSLEREHDGIQNYRVREPGIELILKEIAQNNQVVLVRAECGVVAVSLFSRSLHYFP
jgi:hypothetical protein